MVFRCFDIFSKHRGICWLLAGRCGYANSGIQAFAPTDEETSLNSLDRNGTDKAIRKIFGSIDDFLLTSMSSQMGAMTFINEGSTKRKEILAKFLDLDQFEKKFKLSKNDSIETRALLKKLEDNTFDDDITQLVGQLTDNEKDREKQERTSAS